MDTININGVEVPLNTDQYAGLFGWVTVGGRVEDFARLLNEDGPVAAWTEVVAQYGDLAPEVWQGVLVFVEFGIDTYYTAA